MQRTVVIVDDHPAFRASARTMLEDEGYEVVGEAEDGESGLQLALALEPDLDLLDIALPDVSGQTCYGGYSGPAVKPVALRCISTIKAKTNLPIFGMGGINYWEDAVEHIMAGASAVQVCMALQPWRSACSSTASGSAIGRRPRLRADGSGAEIRGRRSEVGGSC
jgi:CheY-like chemotaxis protein